jgi:hypothetical protein
MRRGNNSAENVQNEGSHVLVVNNSFRHRLFAVIRAGIERPHYAGNSGRLN